MTNMVRCRLRGRLILMMDAPGGKRMPCETTMVRFVPDLNGSNKYLTDDMVTIRGVEPIPGDRDVHMGYIDHRSVCPARAGGNRRSVAAFIRNWLPDPEDVIGELKKAARNTTKPRKNGKEEDIRRFKEGTAMKADWKHNLYRNDEILEKLHLEALDTIITILAEWDGYSADQKLSAIEAVCTFLGHIEDGMKEVQDDDADT